MGCGRTVIAAALTKSPAYLRKPEAAVKLAEVLALAPEHLSARAL